MNKITTVKQKIISAICRDAQRYKLYVIRSGGDEILLEIIRQIEMFVYVPDIDGDPRQFLSYINLPIFQQKFPEFMSPIENDTGRFLMSIEAAYRQKIPDFIPPQRKPHQIKQFSATLAKDLDSIGKFVILLKDFHKVSNPEVKSIAATLIQHTKNVHWIITTNKFLSLPGKSELMWGRQMYGISLKINDLTDSQFELMVQLVNGVTLKEIAEETGLTMRTLHNRKSMILTTLELNDFQLSNFASQHGLNFSNEYGGG